MTLKIFPFGVLMRRELPEGTVEFLVDPEQIALQLATNIRMETGILSPNTIYVSQEGVQKIVVEYRQRQKTAIFLEGSEAPIVVPMPEMVMIRSTVDKGQPDYRIFALKKRPTNLDVPLFRCPLPNLYDDGRVCWGTVAHLQVQQLNATHLEEDWKILLGTPFGSHNTAKRSLGHSADIRQKYIEMEQRKSRVYPKSDLIHASKTLAEVIEELRK